MLDPGQDGTRGEVTEEMTARRASLDLVATSQHGSLGQGSSLSQFRTNLRHARARGQGKPRDPRGVSNGDGSPGISLPQEFLSHWVTKDSVNGKYQAAMFLRQPSQSAEVQMDPDHSTGYPGVVLQFGLESFLILSEDDVTSYRPGFLGSEHGPL